MIAGALALALLQGTGAPGEDGEPGGFPGLPAGREPQIEIAWNRLYDYDEIHALLDRLVETWPDLLTRRTIGRSVEGRELRVYTLNDPSTGPASEKPAMWIDGNVHGNEVQGAEAVVYTAWYLLENRATNERVRELTDRVALHLLPMVNPDGRARWFAEAHSPHSSRTGAAPFDSDLDGETDEDPANDLDGDGNVVQMRKRVPGEGDFRLSPDDPRLLERVPANERGVRGDWIFLGSEGVDDDGDGRTNEDGVGGYDMNRAWPSMWMPHHVQRGAGPYPLYWPETRAIARFLYAHPNVAAVQSFHNAGGMILRGPGAEGFGDYPSEDVAVYDALGEDGERMLPFYRYMVIWKDLYTVFGGFVTWTYEGLGIISFTNELWTWRRNSPDERLSRSRADRLWFDDHLLFGAGFVDWHPYDHPLYGEIEIGGFAKDVGRVPPSFLVEEMLHRNAMFALRHARSMPLVSIGEPEVTDLGGGTLAVDVVFENERLIPTRTARARNEGIGRPDLFTIRGEGVEVLAGGFRRDRFRPEEIDLAEREPERLVSEEGIGGLERVRVRWFVRGGGPVTVGFSAEKARDVTREASLPR